jgi:hypothetical protein
LAFTSLLQIVSRIWSLESLGKKEILINIKEQHLMIQVKH